MRFREKLIVSKDVSSFVQSFMGILEENWSNIKLGSYSCSNEYINGIGATTEYLLITDVIKLADAKEVKRLIKEHIETNEIYDDYLSESLI